MKNLRQMRLLSALFGGDIGRLSVLKRIEHTPLPNLLPPIVVMAFALFLIILWHYFLYRKWRFRAWFLRLRPLSSRPLYFIGFLIMILYSLRHLIVQLFLLILLLIICLLFIVICFLICPNWYVWLSFYPFSYNFSVWDINIRSSIRSHSLR